MHPISILATLILGGAMPLGGPQAEQQPSLEPSASPAKALSGEALASLESRIQAVHNQVLSSVVGIVGTEGPPGPNGRLEVAATATIVTADGYVVTAAHCIDAPGRTVQLELFGGRTVNAQTLGKDRERDFGLLKIEGDGPFPFTPMAGADDLLVADEVVLMYGYPDGPEPERDAVARIGTFFGTAAFSGMLRTSCTMMPGDSGGPLFNLDGRLVGVNSEIDLPLDQNYHVPVSRIAAGWERLVAKEVWGEDPFADWGGPEGQWSDEEEPELGAGTVPTSGFDEEARAADIQACLEEAALRLSGEKSAPRAGEGFDTGKLLPGGKRGLERAFLGMGASAAAASLTSRREGRRLSALGVLCGDGKGGDGAYIVSKSSRVGDDVLRCTLPDGTVDEAEVIRRDRSLDLVLLRMKNASAPSARWAGLVGKETGLVGTIVASVRPGPGDESPAIRAGIIGTGVHRARPKSWGFLGIQLDRRQDRPTIRIAETDGPAGNAGMESGDVVLEFAGVDLKENNDLMAQLQKTQAGDRVQVLVRRAGAEVSLTVTLGQRPSGGGGGHVAYLQEISNRRGGFEAVIRHDAHAEPSECGGPVVGLGGEVFGINIARADRTGMLALPAGVVRRFVSAAVSR